MSVDLKEPFAEGDDGAGGNAAQESERASDGRFHALVKATAAIVYSMSPDWREMRRLDGAGFLADTNAPTTDWIETYIPADERPRVREAINQAMSGKSVFELEHRVLREDGTVGWMFSRAIPLLDASGEIVEWFGTSSDVTARVKADQSFVRLFQASPAPFLVLAPDAPRFTIREVNDAYLAATMTTREGLIGRGVFEAFPDNPDDPKIDGVNTLRASLERVLATGQPDTLPGLKYDIARPDGSFEERWWSPVNSAVLDEHGEVEALIHNANDVTAERRVEAALRISEDRYRNLFDNIDTGFCVVEVKLDAPDGQPDSQIDYRVVEANAAFYAHTGFPPAIFGQWLRQAAPELEEHWYQTYSRVARTGSPERFEQGSHALGRWFDVYAFRTGEPDDRRVAILFNDISARRNVEERLRNFNETLEVQVAARTAERDRLWTLSQDMLARADYSGMMSAVSPAWTQVLGWNEAELLTRPYATFMHPEDMPPTLEAIGRMAETRQPARFENRIATSNGGWKHIEWTVAPEADNLNFIAVGRDISLAKAREAELALAQEALRQSQKMEAMGSLTGGVAHDFNNLLTPIVGVLDMLQRRGLGNDREQQLIANASLSAERAKTLIQRLLAFARRQLLRLVAVDVAKLVTGMADLVSSTIGPQIKVVVDAPADLPPAKADPNQLEMAILNLSVNARDAMPDGGTLRISASAEMLNAGANPQLAPGRYIRISVSDTGIGMDEETRARAVEPFFSTKGVGKGTGLGLSMVHGLASQLGGALAINSTPGLGTNIELLLPQTGATPDTPAAVRDVEAPPSRGAALIVDDEELVRQITADMLRDLGYRVVEVASAEHAMRVIDGAEQIDLVITDHLMPGMTGADLARAIHTRRPDLPVLLVSGYAEVDALAADLPRLSKPFRRDELAASLAGLMSERPATLRN